MADIFTSQIRFYGKHGTYLEALPPGTEKAKDDTLPDIERYKYLFDTVVDIYIIAPLVGYLYQRKADKDGNEVTKNIMEGALASHKDKLEFSFELVMILDKDNQPDLDERIKLAFRANDSMTSDSIALYNAYARGGIEVLYEALVESAASPEDLAINLVEFVDDFNERFLTATSELDLDNLL